MSPHPFARRLLLLSTIPCLIGVACGDAGAPADPDADPTADPGISDAGDGDVGEGDGDAPVAGPDPAVQAAVLAVAETGQWTIPGLEGEVHIVRTAADVPHIYASTLHDLYLAHGFVMARDRYFSFELVRRLALGRTSELLGDVGLALDVDQRNLGSPRVAAQIAAGLDEEGQVIFGAYAAGVNAYVDAVAAGTAAPPTELVELGWLLGIESPSEIMTHVDYRDVAAFSAFAVFTSAHSADDLILDASEAAIEGHFDGAVLGELRQAGLETDIWAPADPVVVVSSSVRGDDLETGTMGLGGAPGAGAQASQRGPLAGGQLPVPALLRSRLEALHERLARRYNRRGDHGSNVWAVSGAHTTDGATLLAGDGHLPLGVPPYFMQVGLDTTVFGGGDLHQVGLVLPGFPLLAVGTNGRLAWSQTYPRSDVTDWYREELRLDDDGNPKESRFQGEWRPLVKIDETYALRGALTEEEREVVWPRWETFDGRHVIDLEGTEGNPALPAPEGKVQVATGSGWVIPEDLDGDGVITAISTDFTGYDVADLFGPVSALTQATDVATFQAAQRRFVGYAQNQIAADVDGGLTYGGHTATPCRDYLSRDADGHWLPGAHPNRLLDGTQYGGFEIVLGDDGVPLHQGADEPGRCVVPFEWFPAALDPPWGFAMNANNDPGTASFDGGIHDERYHIGGPWSAGFRAQTIDGELASLVASQSADVAAMAGLQANHVVPPAMLLLPPVVQAIGHARAVSQAEPTGADNVRLAALYEAESAAMDEMEGYLAGWVSRGAVAESGVETFYHSPGPFEAEDAIGAMLYHALFRTMLDRVLGDEDIYFAFQGWRLSYTLIPRTLHWLLEGRGIDNPRSLASWNPDTGESAFFDVLGTPEVERSDEVLLLALTDVLHQLRAAPTAPGVGGFDTDDMSQWLWGLRHQVMMPSLVASVAGDNALALALGSAFGIDTDRLPLAPDMSAEDPRADLVWFPRPGGMYSVDAATPLFFGEDFHYANGPIMRMVVSMHPTEGVSGLNIVPGGQSGLVDSEHFSDQAQMWLANEALPLLYEHDDIIAGAVGREVLRP